MRSRTGAIGAGLFFVQGAGCVHGTGCPQRMKMCAKSGNGGRVMGKTITKRHFDHNER